MKAVAFSVLFFVAFTQANSSWTYCTNPSDHGAVCTKVYSPVCGVKAIGIPQTYGNECEACKIQGVLAHKPGQCKKISEDCQAIKSDSQERLMMQVPFCGFQKEKQFTSSSYKMCYESESYDFIIKGQCPTFQGIHTCKHQDRGKVCTKQLKHVCALKQDHTRLTYDNGCAACSDSKVISYVNGSCKPGAVWCRLEDRKKHCHFKNEVVCGTDADGNQADFMNGCEACSGLSVMSYVAKSCDIKDDSFKLCSKHQQTECISNNKIACVIRYKGIPITLKNTCKVCNQPNFKSYRYGDCQMKTCPSLRQDCSGMEIEKVPSCAFHLNDRFQNVGDDNCCTGAKYDGVIRGKCPQ